MVLGPVARFASRITDGHPGQRPAESTGFAARAGCAEVYVRGFRDLPCLSGALGASVWVTSTSRSAVTLPLLGMITVRR